MLYISSPHTVKVAGRDAVERDRNDADVIAREHQRKQPPKALRVHLRIAEYGGALLKRRDRNVPELGIFTRKTLPPCGHELPGALRQALAGGGSAGE